MHMTTSVEAHTRKPGTTLMGAGLLLAACSALLIVAVVASGGSVALVPVLGILLGLVLAVTGFARRLLHAVETR